MRHTDLSQTGVFAETKNLQAIWDIVMTLWQEFAPLRLVAEKPFLITPKGALYDGPFVNITLRSPQAIAGHSCLFDELVMIAHLIEAGQLSDEGLHYLEEWSGGLVKILEEVRTKAETEMAKYLRDINALN